MNFFLLIVALSILEFFGDASFKIFTKSGSNLFLLGGVASYIAMMFGLIYVLKFSNVSYMNLQWDGMSAIIETTLAFILLGETLSNSTQYLGAFSVILGVILLNFGKIPT
jgi:multidrug transporter EmrE-like cation transporter